MPSFISKLYNKALTGLETSFLNCHPLDYTALSIHMLHVKIYLFLCYFLWYFLFGLCHGSGDIFLLFILFFFLLILPTFLEIESDVNTYANDWGYVRQVHEHSTINYWIITSRHFILTIWQLAHYLDGFFLVLALPFVRRSQRGREFGLKIIRVWKIHNDITICQ